ncbi:DUF4114 domain-containing protein [Luteolibacter sp. LG18]|uniref:DUF4114 domain-containing protein n=1 Tax=Luteolibacter sp. LG18 TaxID=2819286 RepID=UPI002B283D31|nr:hypothetical protein llg_42880 [Luteolibacter sp. LG18]
MFAAVSPAVAESSEGGAIDSRSDASPVQSAARPYSLDIAEPVQLAGSDSRAADFQANVLPGFLKIMNERLTEARSAGDVSAMQLDPSKMTLKYDANVRAYFVGEGAGYRNTLGFSTAGSGVKGSDAELVFPDASSNSGYGGSGAAKRTSSAPLLAGDFVDLGTLSAGSNLDFFLIANGAAGGREVFSTQRSANRDGLVHSVSLAPDGSAFLLIGFEDLYGGGDRDYNDVVFAVEIGHANVASLAAPEPSLALGSMIAGASILCGYRRRWRVA